MLNIKTRYGTFNGFIDENGVKTWLGIPYAKPPVGKLRWRAPKHLQPSDKTFDAKKFGFTAMQTVDDRETSSIRPQSEDIPTCDGKFIPNEPFKALKDGGAREIKFLQARLQIFAATGNPNNEFMPHYSCILHKDLNTENLNSLRYVYEN